MLLFWLSPCRLGVKLVLVAHEVKAGRVDFVAVSVTALALELSRDTLLAELVHSLLELLAARDPPDTTVELVKTGWSDSFLAHLFHLATPLCVCGGVDISTPTERRGEVEQMRQETIGPPDFQVLRRCWGGGLSGKKEVQEDYGQVARGVCLKRTREREPRRGMSRDSYGLLRTHVRRGRA